MRDKIVDISQDLFLNIGFKNITMDDIANNLGVSKKTIYKFFKNKSELVEAVTENITKMINAGIDEICALNKNPIEEIFDIKRFVMKNLKDEKSSPQYQLHKYYPKIYAKITKKQFEIMQGCVVENLKNGIEQGLYRKDIDVSFISRIYFNGMTSIKNKDLFPLNDYSMNTLMLYYLEYHIRGIATKKGIQQLENQLKLK